MNSEIVVGSLSLVGTLLGSGLGVLASAKLTNYRICQLEKKVDKHNSFAERLPVVEEQVKVVNHRITDLEDKYERIVLK
jgi:ABC-type lipoprotein release transport system permease subunit